MALGAWLLIWSLDRPGVILCGGVLPGRWVALVLAIVTAGMVYRWTPPSRGQTRVASAGGALDAVAGPLHRMARLAAAGALLAALAIFSLVPAEVGAVRVEVDLGDRTHDLGDKMQPANDLAYVGEIRDQVIALGRDHAREGLDVTFGSDALDGLVAEVVGTGSAGTDGAWLDALRSLPPLNTRLEARRREFEGQVGRRLIVVSTRQADASVHTWPLDEATTYCRWICIDPSKKPRADRSQVLAISYGDDVAVDNHVTVTVQSPSDPVRLKVVLSGGTELPLLTPAGRHGDKRAFVFTVPRDRQIEQLKVIAPGPAVEFNQKNLALHKKNRRVKVRIVPPEWRATYDTYLRRQSKPGEPPALELVDSGENVVWWLNPGGDPASLGAAVPEPAKGLVEIIPAAADHSADYKLKPEDDYAKTPLGGIWPDPVTVSGFSDLGRGLPLSGSILGRAYHSATNEPGAPFFLLRDSSRTQRVTLVLPLPSRLAVLSAEQRIALDQLLLIATSLARRGGDASDPFPARSLVTEESNLLLATESGPPPNRGVLLRKVLDGLAGAYDGREAITPRNSIRQKTGRPAMVLLSALIGGSALAWAIELWLGVAARRRST